MTGERIDAEEALRLGILNRVLPAEGFQGAAFDFAQTLAEGPASALAQIKRGVHLGASAGLDEVLEFEAEAQTELFLGDNAREGMRAFLEKRPPRFGR